MYEKGRAGGNQNIKEYGFNSDREHPLILLDREREVNMSPSKS